MPQEKQPQIASAQGSNENLRDRLIPLVVDYEASDFYTVAGYYPSMKVNGQIYAVTEDKRKKPFEILEAEDVEKFIQSITTEKQYKRFQEELETDYAYSFKDARFRVNIFHQMKRPSCVVRYLRSQIPSIDSLGLPPICKTLAERPAGIILLAGPTGCGKSTTLSAMVDHINTNFTEHIITIEDPVEYLHPIKKSIIEQREVETDTITFARAMKSSLRQNPSVLVLGEMRDLESISSAIAIAETGHLVFSTIHAQSSVRCINKIIDSFPAQQQNQIRTQLAETLIAIISQRLVPSVEGKKQVLAMEIMVNNSAIANMIRENQSHQIESVIQTGKTEGMRLLDEDLARLVAEKKIKKENAVKFSNNPRQTADALK